MTSQLPTDQDSLAASAPDPSGASDIRDRVETERLVGRKRHAWRVFLALFASAVLLLLALGLRRDQVRRELAVEDLLRVADRLDRWVHEQGALPLSFQTVFTEQEASEIEKRYRYASEERIRLTLRGSISVALVYTKQPSRLLLGEAGRAVMFYRKGDFDVKWLSESDFIRQQSQEAKELKDTRQTPLIQSKR